MRRSAKTKEILTVLIGGISATAEILDKILPNYHRSYKNAKQTLYSGSISTKKELKKNIAKQQFYSLLNHLKRHGLVEKRIIHNETLWKITLTGIDKLRILKERGGLHYEPEKDNKLKIIIFDVPEKEKWKRAWLRDALRQLDFRILQKSVWVGKSKIPEAFLEDLRYRRLLNYIHVLEVSKTGTVVELT
ncbi:hypothetical protein A3G55_01625 [Candidatus Giovannonibacteria bacterium RIFCSPLOWO2_12_FULL_44_25]|uniref:Transcriptional repressor PaaX-like central Cas2-like domain-containing protein n=3 Tax=Parcubacteria group TaxID=1794811 RepID=A0A837IH12_9BACT|nr:MAG: hypothetical protein UW15_C0004G0010 [Parcubacteria group bacterium GW2011_GWC1_44_10]KKT60145.1 MAG: hypothetical protein UW53_C0003G0056 [Candidatus Giovannonibacteria bacterium GW2011_GWA1_44_25]KKU12643.1 MAG: hypothetical protein UX18_C0016G0006 [Candidatus Azambacteria bacterium GW2011_GWC2_45_7b]KKU29992.1 MAG: hypothetical protein UX43_C0003G0085 [Candidatus Giovannonibacteria bacterium GW2011_GWB1_46_20]OGF49350.1 MAG: hypothetical protein A2120_03460 [Candidatus Giovannonibact